MLANNQFADENAGQKVRNEDENASQNSSATEQIENKLEHNFLFVIYRMLVQTIQMPMKSGKMLCDIWHETPTEGSYLIEICSWFSLMQFIWILGWNSKFLTKRLIKITKNQIKGKN